MRLISPFYGWIVGLAAVILGAVGIWNQGKRGAEQKAKMEADKVDAQRRQADAEASQRAAEAKADAANARAQIDAVVAPMLNGKAEKELKDAWSRD
jgi:uncharacterized protein YqfA (UPF0365 family)